LQALTPMIFDPLKKKKKKKKLLEKKSLPPLICMYTMAAMPQLPPQATTRSGHALGG